MGVGSVFMVWPLWIIILADLKHKQTHPALNPASEGWYSEGWKAELP